MPQPYLVATAPVVRSGATGTAFVPLPPHKAGDIVGYLLSHDQVAQAANVAVAGFTRKTDHQNGLRSFQLWWRRALADEEADPVIDHTFSTVHSWAPFTIRGAIESGDPFDVVATASNGAGADAPSVTTTVADCGILTGYFAESAPLPTAIANANTNPRGISFVPQADHVAYPAWGHKATAGSTGVTTYTMNAGVLNSTGTWAIKPASEASAYTATAFRDSILSTAATGSVITLPTHADGDLLVAIGAGDDDAAARDQTLTGFTRKQYHGRSAGSGRALGLFTLRATSAAMANPTWTHTFGADRALIIFSIPGDLVALNWDRGGNNIAINNIESASPAKVVGYFNSHASENWTGVSYDVAGAATEVEDGGTGACRVALYHADLAAAGWIGRPSTHTVQFGSGQAWLTMGFAEPPPPPVEAFGQGHATAWGTSTATIIPPTPPPSPPSGGADGNRIGGTGAIRRAAHRRRRMRR